MDKRVVVIDGNSLMFRAYYATAYTGNLMQASNGLYTNALYGFVNMMNKIIDTMQPTHMLVAFDAGKQTFRHQQYSDYKGTRKKMPEELGIQIPLIKEYLQTLGIKQLELFEYEADDIVGSMARLASKLGHPVEVISGDKDLLQLVDDNITVHLTKKGITELDDYTVTNFEEKLGFKPNQHVDYKAMIGDSSDNLPGVKGVGPKTALNLLKEYGSLEKIIENIPALKGKVAEAFENDKEQAIKTKFLATIYTEVPFDFSFEDTALNKPNYQSLRKFFEKVEFKSFLRKLEIEPTQENKVEVNYNYHYGDLTTLKEKLNQEAYLDIELDGDNYHKANILGMSILVGEDVYFLDKVQIFDEDIKNYLISDYHKNVIDLKKTIVSLSQLGLEIKNVDFDLMLASYVLNPSYASGDIKTVLENFKPTNVPYHEEVYSKKTKYVVPAFEVYAEYTMKKAVALKEVKDVIVKDLTQENLVSLLKDIEIPLAYVLAEMEINGFKVSTKTLEDIKKVFSEKIDSAKNKIYELAGHEFNIASPKQLGVVLFEELALGKGKKNKTGYSTSVEVLESLKDVHPIIEQILEFRKYSKLVSTYVDGLSSEIHSTDGKVHTIFKQYLTMTGRLSSVEPNIQNIPIRTEEGKIIRSAFIPSNEDGYLVSADYSQIELRILASLSKSKAMLEAFNNKVDLHSSTASKIHGVPLEEVTKEMRRRAKAVNFGIVYGMSDWGLSETLHIAPWEAAEFIEKYFRIYPEIKVYLEETIKNARSLGYTETIFKRRRYIPELNSSNYNLQKFGERTAMNAPIQGSAADVIKIAMIDVFNKMKELSLKSKMVAQVHDELIIDTTSDELEIVKQVLKETMEKAVILDVLLEAEVEFGKTWDLK
ncbi:MAG: DNA polymerase I [Bacilli bacterium]|nr:DNA polymerase I [Bacilli bacterium]